MKVKDFANKIAMSSEEQVVKIKRGMNVIETIADIKYLKSNSDYLNETVNFFYFRNKALIIQIKY